MLTYSDNLQQWQKTLRLYADYSTRDWEYICNKKALDLAIKCVQNTQSASPMAIKAVPEYGRRWYGQVVNWMKEHGGIRGRVLIQKRGQSKGGRRVKSLASWNYTVGQASRRMIGSRLSAVGFLKSGWLAAVGQMLAITGTEGRRSSYGSGRVFGNPKGFAVRARPGFNPFAIIANTCASYAAGTAGKPNATHSSRTSSSAANRMHDLIQKGAVAALQASDKDMRGEIERRIAARIKYFTGY